jgi:alpha-D-ribose 1-methylphosphonate 5-triphosphate synthase subunit PhnH
MSSTEASERHADAGRFVRRARLDGERSQVAFSLLLATLAHPGTVRSVLSVELPAGVPIPLVVPLALADVEVPVAVVTGDPDSPWPDLVRDVTGAPLVEPAHAAMAVLLDGFGPEVVTCLPRGTSDDPDRGAKVAIACRALHGPSGDGHGAAGGEVVIELSGPGVDGSRRLGVDGLDVSVIEAVAESNRTFPAGIDCWLASPTGEVAAIPRSAAVHVVHPVDSNEGNL